MLNRSTWRAVARLALLVLAVFTTSLEAQEKWQSIELSARGRPIPTLKAVGIKAKAECNGQSYSAFVFVWGRQGSGIYTIGIVISGFDGVIPEAELDKYRGPDLSEKAMTEDVISINLHQDRGEQSFSARLLMTTSFMLPNYVRGASREYFGTNPHLGNKKEKEEWHELLAMLSRGIADGHIVIGGGGFPKEIVIRFGGEGVATPAKELMQFIAEK
jgi:hypothetical protein